MHTKCRQKYKEPVKAHAPIMAERKFSEMFEGWEKWQIAVAVGAPVCLGLAGLWFYHKSKKPDDGSQGKATSPAEKQKVKSSPIQGSSGENVRQETPISAAQECKNNGNKCFKQGKYDEAIKCYTQALELCPPGYKTDMSVFYANRAAAYDKLKDYKNVLENCTEAIKLNGKYAKALSRRAHAAEQLGDLQLSLEDVTAVCILEGFQNQSTLQMADRVLKNLGKNKAKEELKNKKASMPSKHSIKSYFASFTQDPIQECFSNDTSSQTSESINFPVANLGFDVASENNETTPATFSVDVESESADTKPTNLSLEGASEHSENKPANRNSESAEGDAQTIDGPADDGAQQQLKNGSDDGKQDPTQLAETSTPKLVNGEHTVIVPENSVFRKVVDKLNTGDYEELIPLCTQEVDVTPPTHYQQLALLLRGTMFYLTAQSDQALEDFDQLLRIDNLDKKVKVNALIKRGSLLLTRDQQTNGLADFAQATRVDPQNSDIYHHRGHQNIQIDRLEDAVRDFENSISKNADFPNSYVQKSYAEHRRAAAEQSTTKLEKAIQSYEETLKKFPNNADGHSLYAQALCDLGRFDDADNEFELAVKLEPGNANTLVQRALLKLQWKQTIEESVALIKQAIELDDKCEYAYEMLGTIEVQRGDMVNAVRLFEKAIQLCRTESEMSHLFSLLNAAKAQLRAAETLGIPLPPHFSPM